MTRIAIVLVALFAGAALSAQAPERNRPPAIGPAPTLKLPAIAKNQLSSGLPVWIVESHEVPVVQVNLVVRSGSGNDPVGKFGIASLVAAMLTEGAGSRAALEIADAVDFLGADLSAASGFDSTSVRLHVPAARLSQALPVMADVALRPTFPAAELERLRQQRLTGLRQARDDAGTVASLTFARVLFRQGRYGSSAMGSEASLRRFAVDDLRAFYTTHFLASSAALIVVGDVTPAQVMPLLETHFGGWKEAPKGPTAGIRLGGLNGPPRNRREIYLVDKPGAPQSQIRIGLIGAPRVVRDYFQLQVMNTVLGGSFSSRLNMNLREKHGYTYGASSGFDMRLEPGPFTASAGVQTDKTAEALTEFFNELNGMLQPVPAEELSRAKNYLSLRYPGGFETTGDISRRLEDAFVYGLGDDYFATYVPGVNAVTAADVQRVMRQYVPLDTVAVVVVGDRKTIEPRIAALNLGPIIGMTIDEVFAEP